MTGPWNRGNLGAMKRQLTAFLIILLLLFGIGLSFHHHEDGLVHNNCTSCIAASHNKTLTQNIRPQAPPSVSEFISAPPGAITLFTTVTADFAARAPPALS